MIQGKRVSPRASLRHSQRKGAMSPLQIRRMLRSVTTWVMILLGFEEEPRYVPKELLTITSPFFTAALNGPFAESASQIIRLPEDRADVFDYFLFWLYTRRLDHEAVDAIDPIKPAYFWLLHLYCMVNKFMIESCKNSIVEKIARLAESTNSVPTPTDTWIIFETFEHQEDNPLKKLIVDLFAFKKTENLIDTHQDEWHPRFMRDLMIRLKRTNVWGTEKPWTKHMCRLYHEHMLSPKCS